MPLPLEGVRVLDLSRLYPGPLASVMLSDMGAEVIKIEDEVGDGMRFMPPIAADGNSVGFHTLNRGKKSIKLNLKQEEDRKKLLILIQNAHVLLESFRPKVLERLLNINNIQDLFEYNPNLIIARISAFGQNAPVDLLNVPAHDMNSLARAGVFHINDIKDRIPNPLPLQAADLLSGYTCCMQICAALYQNKGLDKSQKGGKVIDVSMYDVSIASIILPVSRHLSNGSKVSGGIDQLAGAICCYDIYPTKQGYLSVGCLEVHFWKAFAKAIGLPSQYQSTQAMFATGENKNKLKILVEEKLKARTAHEWEQFLAFELKLPVLELRYPEDLANDELLDTRRMVSLHQDKKLKTINPGLDYTSFLKEKQLTNQKAPLLGEHNAKLTKSKL